MSFLRHTSIARLLALCTGAVAMVFACVAVAAAVSSDPAPPPPRPLAQAVHAAAAAPPEQGVTARVEWTNKLVDANGFEGISPLISGGRGRLWWSAGGSLRLELQGSSGDVQVVVHEGEYWAYDAASNQAWRGKVPPGRGREKHQDRVPTVAQIERRLHEALAHVAVTGPDPGVQAGQPSYSVRISPRERGGLLGAVGLAWDAARGTPLRAGLYARGSNSPVAELSATDVHYGPVDAGAFDIEPPPGAEVTEVNRRPGGHSAGARARAELGGLAFDVARPATLGGKPRTAVRPIGTGDRAGAAVVYGRGLGAILVVQRPYVAPRDTGSGDEHAQVELPTTDVNGASARLIDTPLGSALEWTRGGVTFVVAASAPRSVVEAAAREL